MFVIVGLLASPTTLTAPRTGTTELQSHPVAPAAAVSPGFATPVKATENLTFPRTVLIETFTAVWCIHCPAESQALFDIDKNTSRSVLDIAELHVCAFAAGQGPCLENYVPPDGTSDARAAFYSVCGFPDVFFDGGHSACGATNSMTQMASEYESAISNASAIPGNVSISENASIVGGNVSSQANVTSGLTGSYNAITYLMEYIGKRNVTEGYGPHDLGWVVRETLFNHPVSLTAGATTEINGTGPLNTTWNQQNLSVVTFVQQNSTKIVENANMAPVTTLATSVVASPGVVGPGSYSTITVHARNSSTGEPIVGADVTLWSHGIGQLSATSGVTSANGTFTANFTAPKVNVSVLVPITANVTATGYTAGTGTSTLIINPLITPDVPTGLTVAPAGSQVVLNWTTPASGGVGLAYTVFRATSEKGTYSQVGVSASTTFTDNEITAGQSYWYKVDAFNAVDLYSANTTAVSATSVAVVTQGLPSIVGWWFAIDGANFSSSTNATLDLYLPNGLFSYDFGPLAYGFLAYQQAAPLLVAGASLSVNASFSPRYATLSGTVTPVDATVTVDGAAVTVSGGSFTDSLVAGTYTVVVSSNGFKSSSQTVLLTPGNTTKVTVALQAVAATGTGNSTTSSSSGLSTEEELGILAVVAVVGIALLGGLMLVTDRRRRIRPPSNGSQGEQ